MALGGAGQAPEEEESERTDPFALPEWATRAREAEARTLTMEKLILGSAFTLRAGAERGAVWEDRRSSRYPGSDG